MMNGVKKERDIIECAELLSKSDDASDVSSSVDVSQGVELHRDIQLSELGVSMTVVKECEDPPTTVSFFIPKYNGLRVIDPRNGSVIMGEADYTKVDYVCLDKMPKELQTLIIEFMNSMIIPTDPTARSIFDAIYPSARVVNVRKKCAELLKSLLYVEQATRISEEEMLMSVDNAMKEFERTESVDFKKLNYTPIPVGLPSSDDIVTVKKFRFVGTAIEENEKNDV
jgi:hypothetical protein